MKSLADCGIKVEKRIHKGWEEHKKMQEIYETIPFLYSNHPRGHFGKYQWIFSSPWGNISLIQLLDYNRIGEDVWEIYCLDKSSPASAQLEDVRRFKYKEDAIKYIKKLLRND